MINLELIQNYFMLFLIYSFCGWLIEVIYEFILSRKIINRGFLIGPVCPVYGFGALLITILISQYSNDYFAIFGLSLLLCGTLEYFTSYILEKLFNARWWDYSNEKFNIKGRICLENLLWFGAAGVAVIKLINPILNNLFDIISIEVKNAIFYSTLTIFVIDTIVSLTIISKIRKITSSVKNQFKDNTEEISKKVRERILEKSSMYRRYLEAFPHAFSDKIKQGKEKITQVANEIKQTAIEKKDKSKRITKYKINKIKRTISKSKIMTIAKRNNEKEIKNEDNN